VLGLLKGLLLVERVRVRTSPPSQDMWSELRTMDHRVPQTTMGTHGGRGRGLSEGMGHCSLEDSESRVLGRSLPVPDNPICARPGQRATAEEEGMTIAQWPPACKMRT
jgi:hypothetical protein